MTEAIDLFGRAATTRAVTTNLVIHVPQHDGEAHGIDDIYRKATHGQWDVHRDVAWSLPFDERNPLAMADGTNPLASTPIWAKLDEKQKIEVRRSLQSWHVSQILHGERASLLCAGKLMLSSVDASIKHAAAIQATDEARHIEAFSMLLGRVGEQHPVSPSLQRLLDDVLADSDPGITALGMQILIEGLALAFFRSLQSYSGDPLTKSLLTLIGRDEARHFAVGQVMLHDQHKHLSQADIDRREEFVVEACHLLSNYLFADELWGPLGLPARECAELSRSSPVNQAMHRVLFRHLVPAIRGIGLLGPRARRHFETMGVLDYAALPA